MADLKDFIVRTSLNNTDTNGESGNPTFNTQDYVFLPAYSDMYPGRAFGWERRYLYPSDYAIMNGVGVDVSMEGPLGFKNIKTVCYVLRTGAYDWGICEVTDTGRLYRNIGMRYDTCWYGLNPAMHLNIESVISARSTRNFKIKPVKDRDGRVQYYTIGFGSYPQDRAKESETLEQLFKENKLTPTGKTYTGYMNEDGSFQQNQEFEYNGKKYVRVVSGVSRSDKYTFKDKTRAPVKGTPVWAKVQPIKWQIRNWDELPKELNPNGNGTAKTMFVTSEDALLSGIPFAPNMRDLKKDEIRKLEMWQNSIIRAYFNGYDIYEEIDNGNGNKAYKSCMNVNFKGKGFLQEAFGISFTHTNSVSEESKQEPKVEFKQEPKVENKQAPKVETQEKQKTEEKLKEVKKEEPKVEIEKPKEERKEPKAVSQEKPKPEPRKESLVRRTRLEKLNPDQTPARERRRMTDTEMIKSWIDSGQSVLLRGPSGIGKTERIKKLYPDLIYIKLTNNMFPEKVVGSMNLQTGQAIPPDFAKQAFLSCATDEEKKLIQENVQNLYDLSETIYERSKTSEGKVVIMLDELLNVKPAVQSLVYTLVLNKLVETGKGLKLPANTVVVATGNQKKYSQVAEDLAEPLEKRFDHILDMQPKVGEWIYEYAIPEKLHPSVIGYIFSKYQENRHSEKIERMGYFYEEPEVGEDNLDQNGCRGRTNDPRGWSSISNTLYAFEEDLKNGKFVGKDVEKLLKVSLNSKLRDEWAEEFFDYYNHPTITVEEVVEQRYSQVELPRDINEKFATMAGLLDASNEQVGACREFIKRYCSPEYLAVYDIYWAGNDEKRMEKISELKEISAIKIDEDGGLTND